MENLAKQLRYLTCITHKGVFVDYISFDGTQREPIFKCFKCKAKEIKEIYSIQSLFEPIYSDDSSIPFIFDKEMKNKLFKINYEITQYEQEMENLQSQFHNLKKEIGEIIDLKQKQIMKDFQQINDIKLQIQELFDVNSFQKEMKEIISKEIQIISEDDKKKENFDNSKPQIEMKLNQLETESELFESQKDTLWEQTIEQFKQVYLKHKFYS